MNSHDVFCPNPDCPARGRCGEGNIWMHARTPLRYRCTVCQKTFSERAGTLFHRRQIDEATIICILTLLAHGCPPAAIASAFGVQRQTVRGWQDVAGRQSEAIHQHLVCQPRDLGAVVRQIRRMARSPEPRDGKRGRCRLREWPGLVIGHAAQRAPVKQRGDGHIVGVTRRLAHGTARWAERLLGGGTIQTASIERLNGTFRARLTALARRTRAGGRTVARLERGMWLVGTIDNFCTPHASLAGRQTPAMAADITDHVWSVDELLHCHVPPPPWRPPKKWGRRTKAEEALIARWVA